MAAADEALLDFKPDENEIDGKLYDGIVEINQVKSKPRMPQIDDVRASRNI